jgi:hypothetical protein
MDNLQLETILKTEIIAGQVSRQKTVSVELWFSEKIQVT